MNFTTIYRCECGKEHRGEYAADLCCRPPLRSTLKPGDIVTFGYGRGWFDGDRRWVINARIKVKPGPEVSANKKPPKHWDSLNCFDKCCTMGFYYVVTAVDRDERDLSRPRIHLETLAMSGKQGYRKFYNYECPGLVKVERPKAYLIRTSRDLVGTTADHYGS